MVYNGLLGSSQAINEDVIFNILSNKRRRFVLHALRKFGTVELDTLAERVAAWEKNISVSELGSSARKSVYTSLQQLHLPRMDDAGILEYDQRSGIVEPTPVVDELDIYIEVISGNEIPWHMYYLGLGALGTVILLALFVDVPLFTALPDLAWVSFLVATLLVSAGAHTIMARKRRLGRDARPPEVKDG